MSTITVIAEEGVVTKPYLTAIYAQEKVDTGGYPSEQLMGELYGLLEEMLRAHENGLPCVKAEIRVTI